MEQHQRGTPQTGFSDRPRLGSTGTVGVVDGDDDEVLGRMGFGIDVGLRV
jgi:hypothetical protein